MRKKTGLVQTLQARFEGKDAEKIVSLSFEEFGDGLAMTTAFGYSGVVLMSIVRDAIPQLPIYFIDTGCHFEETLKFAEKIRSEWGLNIEFISTQFTEEELDRIIGKDAYRRNPDLCCHYRKVEPLLRVLRKRTAWLSAIRRDQSATRAGIDVVEVDGRGTIKINPLCDWTGEQTWMYVRRNGLPYNPLHDQHYPSIGCSPCTSPVDMGGSEREGRWRGFMKLECGIHVRNDGREIR